MITIDGLNKRGTTRCFNKLLYTTLRNVNGCLKNKKPVIRLKDDERVKRDGSPTEICTDNQN